MVGASLSQLTAGDVGAIVAYLRSVPAIHSAGLPAPVTDAASDMPKLMQAGFDPRGKQVFEGACASCHSWSGVSLLTSDATLTGDRAVNDRSAINVAQIVIAGGGRPGALVHMPAFGAAYSDERDRRRRQLRHRPLRRDAAHLTAAQVAELRRSSVH